MAIRALVTDLDGTLIPLPGSEQNRRDLEALRTLLSEHEILLVFASGRHRDSVEHAIEEFQLPFPDWAICDVGTSLLRTSHERAMEPVDAYADHLRSRVETCPVDRVREMLLDIRGLRLQEDEKQSQFKLSYYTAEDQLSVLSDAVRRRLRERAAPWSLIQSVDPFTADGLIDVLPQDASKASAVNWWAESHGLAKEQIIYAGDSGNDLAALTAGYLSITVGNTAEETVVATRQAHANADWANRHHESTAQATSGVLDGVLQFQRMCSE